MRTRKLDHDLVFTWLAPVVLAGAALFFYWLPILPQRNAHWVALLLPLHLGLLLGFRRR